MLGLQRYQRCSFIARAYLVFEGSVSLDRKRSTVRILKARINKCFRFSIYDKVRNNDSSDMITWETKEIGDIYI